MFLILFSFFADSVNLKLLKTLPYDLPVFIEINDNLMYTAGGDYGEYYTVYSLDDPYHPRIISQWFRDINMSKGGIENSIFLCYANKLYRSNEIMNIEDPYNIFYEGKIDPGGSPKFMQIRDTILFADMHLNNRIYTYSLSDPSSPLELSSYQPQFLSASYMQRYFVLDTLCFITDGLRFEVVNVKDPENLYFAAFNDSVIKNQAHNISISGKNDFLYLYLVFENYTGFRNGVFSEETLYTIDCSRIDSIVVVDKEFIRTVDAYPYYRFNSIIWDTLLYTLSDPTGYDSAYLASFSISNPDDPLLMNEYHGEWERRFDGFIDLDFSDSLLYLNRGLSGITVLNPFFEHRGNSCYSGYTVRMNQRNNIIYTGTYGCGIRIFKETEDTIYEITEGGQRYDVRDIALFDTLLYASSEFGGFFIFSIKDSSNPVLTYQDSLLSDSFWSEKIAVDSNYIYLTRESQNLARFYILDRYDYSIVSTLDSVWGNINLRDTTGFIGDKILNLSDKTNPFVITDLGDAYSNALKDSILFLSNGELYSVAQIDSPVLLTTLPSGEGEFRGDSIYICKRSYPSQIYVYDVCKPDSAYLVAYGKRPESTMEINYIYPTSNRRIFTDGCFYLDFIESQGIKEENLDGMHSLMAVDYITLKGIGKCSISLFDVTGRRILKKDINGDGKIYVKNLSTGVYFISIPKMKLWKKVVIVH